MKDIVLSARSLQCRDVLFVGGAYCRFATNSPALVYALGSRWRAKTTVPHGNFFDAVVRVGDVPGRQPSGMHFRGVEQFVFASFPQASFCFDLNKRQMLGFVSRAVAADRRFWDCVLLPIALGVLGPALGISPTHCASFRIGTAGVLLGGVSGAGKSTLTFALGRRGVPIVADDWTYVARDGEGLAGLGLEIPFKLMPDSVVHFPELALFRPSVALNGELAFEVPSREVAVRMEQACRPRLVVLLERGGQPGCAFQPLDPALVRQYFAASAERLPARMAAAEAARAALIESVAGLECWRMRYEGTPQYGAEALHEFCLEALCSPR